MADRPERGWTWWRAVQCVLAAWLVVSPVGYAPEAATAIVVKDVAAGLLLAGATLAAVVDARARAVEEMACVVLGCLLVAASFVLDHTHDGGPLTAQWNQLAVGVLLICLGTARTR